MPLRDKLLHAVTTDGDTKDADTKTADVKDADTKDVGATDVDANAGDTKDADVKDGDTKDADTKDAGTTNDDATDGDTKDADLTSVEVLDALKSLTALVQESLEEAKKSASLSVDVAAQVKALTPAPAASDATTPDAVVKERDDLKAELETVKSELATARDEIAALKQPSLNKTARLPLAQRPLYSLKSTSGKKPGLKERYIGE